MDLGYGSRDVSWFITTEASTDDYKAVTDYIQRRDDGGTAERWHVILPAQRMEADAVTIWVEGILLWDLETTPRSGYARRLDIYRQKGKS
jgi:hypothetical protein